MPNEKFVCYKTCVSNLGEVKLLLLFLQIKLASIKPVKLTAVVFHIANKR